MRWRSALSLDRLASTAFAAAKFLPDEPLALSLAAFAADSPRFFRNAVRRHPQGAGDTPPLRPRFQTLGTNAIANNVTMARALTR